MMTVCVSAGRFLFRYRSYVPVAIYVTMLLLPPHGFNDTGLLWAAGLGVAASGVGLRLWAIRHIGKRARTTKDKARYLIATGPFSLCRNPLYIANMLTGSAFCILFGLPWLVPAYVFVIGLFYSFIVVYEESLLTGIFEDVYARYAGRVPRWVPRIRIPASNRELYPWRRVLRWERSYIGILALGMTAALLKSALT